MWSYILSLPDQTTGKSCTSLSVHLQSLFNQNQQAWLLPRYLTFEFPYLYWQIMFSTLPCMLRSFSFFLQLLFADSVPLNHGSHARAMTWMKSEWKQSLHKRNSFKTRLCFRTDWERKLYIIVMQLSTTTYHYLLYTMSTYNNPSYTILSKIYL